MKLNKTVPTIIIQHQADEQITHSTNFHFPGLNPFQVLQADAYLISILDALLTRLKKLNDEKTSSKETLEYIKKIKAD